MWLRDINRRLLRGAAPGRGRSRPLAAALRVRELESRLTPSVTPLASFSDTHVPHPAGVLTSDSAGDLYGTTSDGGTLDLGTVFEVARGSGTITTLASFDGKDGQFPAGGLVMDAAGNLYGTTELGGASGDGTVFEVARGSGTVTALASLNGTNGAGPQSSLIMDAAGNLYGTAEGGGTSALGTVFELARGSRSIHALASFGGADGAYPIGGLIMDTGGNLYGTTSQGGAAGDGTVFELPRATGAITTLASFNGIDGSAPLGDLAIDGSGNLYGAAQRGGASGDGTVFEVAAGSGTITALASFDGTNGKWPNGGMVMDSAGTLYGTAYQGGGSNAGTVFKLGLGSATISRLASFNPSDGKDPQAGLVMDNRGNLYGTTTAGGAFLDGTVFEVTGAVPTDQWTGANVAVDTNWSDGANWSTGAPPTSGQIAVFTKNARVKSFTATVDPGFGNPVGGLYIDNTWGGTITVDSALSVTGGFTLASGSLGGSAAVTIAGGTNYWTGGQIVLGAGGFTNMGTLYADTTAGSLVLTGAGTLMNDGTINEAGTNSVVLENTAALSSAAGATFDLTDNGSISQSGGGTFTNAGTLEKSGGTGTSTVGTTTLDNTGTVAVSSGTLDVSATVTQVSKKTLKGGHWSVIGSPAVPATLDITSAANFTTLGFGAAVMLNGPNSVFANLSALATLNKGTRFSLLGGQSFTTAGALTNNGHLTLSPMSVLTVAGSFAQTSTGGLTVELGGTDAAPTFAQLVSTGGEVSVAGSLDVTSTVVPAVNSSFAILQNQGSSPISGAFAGLPEGGTFTVTVGATTMTFQITYLGAGADGNNNVSITRIS
jgi:uncharacterized repeat protein (TIGR03803 family)